MNRSRLRTVLVAVLALGFTAPAVATEHTSSDGFKIARSGLFHDGTNYVESIDLVFDVDGGGALSLGTSSGSVDVRTWAEDKVRLVITKRAPAPDRFDAKRVFDLFRVQALHGGRDLTVTGRARSTECADRVGVSYTIWVPKTYNLDLETKKGNIDIVEVDGVFSVRTAEGTIRMESTSTNLDVEVEDESATPGESRGDVRDANSANAGPRRSGH